MWRRREELAATGAEVLLVSFESVERIIWYLEETEAGWPVLSDPERRAYRAYGLGRGGFARVWLSPRTVWFYLREALRGRRLRRPRSDARQLGGDFVISAEGAVLFAYRSSEPADRPTVDRLLEALRARDG